MTPAEAEALVPLAAELIATLRDYSPADVAAVLDRVPDHRALAVVLAAMVDPDARPSELLSWVEEPVQSREFTAGRPLDMCDECGEVMARSSISRHLGRRHRAAS